MKHLLLLLLSFVFIKAMEEKRVVKSLQKVCEEKLISHQSNLAKHDKTASQKQLDHYENFLQTREVSTDIQICFAQCLICHYLQDQSFKYCRSFRSFLPLMPLPLYSEIAYNVMAHTTFTLEQKNATLQFMQNFYNFHTSLGKKTDNFLNFCANFLRNYHWTKDPISFSLHNSYKSYVVNFLLKQGHIPSMSAIRDLITTDFYDKKKIKKLKLLLQSKIIVDESNQEETLLKYAQEQLLCAQDQEKIASDNAHEHYKKAIEFYSHVVKLLNQYAMNK